MGCPAGHQTLYTNVYRCGTACVPTAYKAMPGAAYPHIEKATAALKAKLTAALDAYRKDYAAYYAKCKHANSPAMRDPNPTVVLIPGLGMIAWGKDKSESRVTAEFYNCAVEVMRGAEAIDQYIALPQQEAFDIEYWLLEEAKLKRMPAEKELARQVILVIGSGSGIGAAIAVELARRGHTLAYTHLNSSPLPPGRIWPRTRPPSASIRPSVCSTSEGDAPRRRAASAARKGPWVRAYRASRPSSAVAWIGR